MVDSLKVKIGNLEFSMIQGGMGVGISLSGLASAVANCGGAGIIASVAIGTSKGYPGSYIEANNNALRDEIETARKMSNGVIGVNIMRALTNYKDLVKVAVEEKVDLIISGAGLPLDLPNLVGNAPIKLIPIVSSQKAAEIITKYWSRKHNKIPDAIIVEGPKAGGHLGFKFDDLINNKIPALENIVKEVVNFGNNSDYFKTPIPIIAAGGIYTGADIAKYLKLGATGVQMATRFVTTKECDATNMFKWAYINASKEDIQIIKSPVGMPGRAIVNPFLKKVMRGDKIDFDCKYKCLETCNPRESPYCIADALIEVQQDDFTRGFIFAGANAYKATKDSCLDESKNFISVETLMQRILDEYTSSIKHNK